jgi:hypothetical protein
MTGSGTELFNTQFERYNSRTSLSSRQTIGFIGVTYQLAAG